MIHERLMHINGIPVYIAHPITVPNYRIDDKVRLGDEYRKYINNWLFNFFGGTIVEVVETGTVMKSPDGLVMNQQTYDKVATEMEYLNSI